MVNFSSCLSKKVKINLGDSFYYIDEVILVDDKILTLIDIDTKIVSSFKGIILTVWEANHG